VDGRAASGTGFGTAYLRRLGRLRAHTDEPAGRKTAGGAVEIMARRCRRLDRRSSGNVSAVVFTAPPTESGWRFGSTESRCLTGESCATAVDAKRTHRHTGAENRRTG